MAIWPWYGEHVGRWANTIADRPAVKRGTMVNKAWGEEREQLPERHSAADFDKLG
jgi:GST-like protein